MGESFWANPLVERKQSKPTVDEKHLCNILFSGYWWFRYALRYAQGYSTTELL